MNPPDDRPDVHAARRRLLMSRAMVVGFLVLVLIYAAATFLR